MSEPAGVAVNNGPARRSSAGLLPRLPPRRAGRRITLSRVRLAAPVAPSRARCAGDRPCRLRRVLRHDREARRSDACGQAGDRRRTPARRRAHGLLRGAHVRRAIGDADVRGPAAVPACQRGPARHGEIRARRPRGARAHVQTDATGRAGLDRRSLHGPVRYRAPARHVAGQGARALCRRRRTEPRHHRVDRALLNKFLAKIASDLDKPRGFAVLGGDEAATFLAPTSR